MFTRSCEITTAETIMNTNYTVLVLRRRKALATPGSAISGQNFAIAIHCYEGSTSIVKDNG
jgi:hypothetical protein